MHQKKKNRRENGGALQKKVEKKKPSPDAEIKQSFIFYGGVYQALAFACFLEKAQHVDRAQ